MPLRCDRSGVEVKRVQEKVSRWLANYDFVSDFNPYLLKVSSAQIDERTTIAMDFSDSFEPLKKTILPLFCRAF